MLTWLKKHGNFKGKHKHDFKKHVSHNVKSMKSTELESVFTSDPIEDLFQIVEKP